MPTATPVETLTAYLSPKTIEVGAGDTFSLDVVIETSGWLISAVDMTLGFEPDVLAAIDIRAGDALGPEPLTGLQVMDNDRGKAQIAVASTGPAVPAGGVLATARFQVQEGVLAQEVLVRLSFRASDEKFEDVPMTAGHSGTVKIR